MLKTILSISGKPGLFKLISQAKNMLIVESLQIKKLISWYTLSVETGNTDFVEEEKTQKDADFENTAATDDSVNEKEEKSKTKKATKKKAE